MIEAAMLWNEPNNLSHWDFELDPGWTGSAPSAPASAAPPDYANDDAFE